MENKPVILMSVQDNIATIIFDRVEKCNAMDGNFVSELGNVLTHCLLDKSVRVLIIKANGDHFCAGADIAWMQHMAESAQELNQNDAMQLAGLMHLIYLSPKPIITLVHGSTLGGGLGLLAASDIAIGASNASFSFSEVKIGITPSVISPYVIAAIGERAAHYYFLTAERFNAMEAQRLGLLHQVVDPEELDRAGLAKAHELVKHSRSALSEVKHLIHHVAKKEIAQELMQFTAEHLAEMRITQDAKEGVQSFLEKRAPNWS